MNIKISIENKIVEVALINEGSVLDKTILAEEYRLSEDLLPTIDELLKKNNLSPKDISEMTLQSDMGENFTTHRIAKAVADAFNWANHIS